MNVSARSINNLCTVNLRVRRAAVSCWPTLTFLDLFAVLDRCPLQPLDAREPAWPVSVAQTARHSRAHRVRQHGRPPIDGLLPKAYPAHRRTLGSVSDCTGRENSPPGKTCASVTSNRRGHHIFASAAHYLGMLYWLQKHDIPPRASETRARICTLVATAELPSGEVAAHSMAGLDE